jgi:hypothetical protein
VQEEKNERKNVMKDLVQTLFLPFQL